ncbi:hypothetical protein P154DRAFT_577070 [Amniculicola lignicola CBS 123094]|uniref:Uncharacterized protein n=1 Tax=Amniculicola lignicola CBS 123094 TaxID=1392246 RepID=A0A6A5WEZ8_9PLEO|nr:hypothetical protein P154DRAFT_577070 [Amniculicola lignicola CBS 123094]
MLPTGFSIMPVLCVVQCLALAILVLSWICYPHLSLIHLIKTAIVIWMTYFGDTTLRVLGVCWKTTTRTMRTKKKLIRSILFSEYLLIFVVTLVVVDAVVYLHFGKFMSGFVFPTGKPCDSDTWGYCKVMMVGIGALLYAWGQHAKSVEHMELIAYSNWLIANTRRRERVTREEIERRLEAMLQDESLWE